MIVEPIQETQAVFDGSQDWVDVTWPDDFAQCSFSIGVSTTDGSIVKVQVTADNPGSSRIEPDARFIGVVNVIRTLQLP